MKRTQGILSLGVLLLALLPSCLKEANETILVHDPQVIPFITDERWPEELLELFGEDHVHFGDTPPRLDCGFVSNHQYDTTNLPPGLSPEIGSVTPVLHYHRFRNPYLQICEYRTMNSAEGVTHVIDTAFVTGHDNLFTVYCLEKWSTDGGPTLAVVMSGELTGKGVADFRYGYQIVGYADENVPPNVYPVNSVFVFVDPDSLSNYCNW
ncbi:MAG: hypothetical protein K5920_07050 [Bacteroidales bacterium]|nr:hypothetical protein [Bacteroidales bacterium]